MKKKVHIWHAIIIVLLSFLAFVNVLSMDFVWDDITQIKNNNKIESITLVKDAFLEDTGTVTSNGEDFTPYYRPLFTISLMIDGILWGKSPFGYHLTNILLHLEVTLLLYFLLLRITGNIKISVMSALLFSIHPVHSEAIAYISARTHLLCTLFFILSFYLYVIAKERQKIPFYALSMISFLFSMLSNEMGVTLPAVVMVYEIAIEKSGRKKFIFPLFYFAFALLYVLARMFILQAHIWTDLPLEYRTLTGMQVIERYIKLLILPLGLKVFYDIPLVKDIFSLNALINLVLLLFHFAIAILFWKKSKPLFFGLVWIFITLLPVSNIPAVIYPSLLSERYLYLPSIGFSIIFGFSCFYVSYYLRAELKNEDYVTVKKISYFAGSILIICFILLTIIRNQPYRNEETLWETSIKQSPESIYSQYKLALAYEENGKIEKAKDEYEQIFQKSPQRIIRDRLIYLYKKTGLSEAEALYKVGVAYLNKGLYNTATVYLMKSIKDDNRLAEAHNALGVVFEEKGLSDKAVEEFRMAVKLNPQNSGYRENLKRALTVLPN